MMISLRGLVAPLVLGTALFAGPALALDCKSVEGVYGDLKVVPQEDDVVGAQLLVMKGAQGWFGVLRVAEGELADPVLVRLDIQDQKLGFTAPQPSLWAGTFKGSIGKKQITGVITQKPADGGRATTLPVTLEKRSCLK